MTDSTGHINRRWGHSWLLLCGALVLYVLDEAVNDFFSVYNPIVERIKELLPYLPLPTYTFGWWITLMIVAVLILTVLSRFAYAGNARMRPLSYLFAFEMAGNGLLHISGSFVLGKLIGGTLSSPVLLACARYLLWILRDASQHAPAR